MRSGGKWKGERWGEGKGRKGGREGRGGREKRSQGGNIGVEVPWRGRSEGGAMPLEREINGCGISEKGSSLGREERRGDVVTSPFVPFLTCERSMFSSFSFLFMGWCGLVGDV